jgi:spore coat polysaccharide biosynthesis protein SpsF
MGSSRLPGKVMMDLCGKPVLWHVVNRVSRAKLINRVMVATSTNKEDDIIEDLCRSLNIVVFRGDSANVLSRYYNCAKKSIDEGDKIDFIVRITADCPVIDPVLIDEVIQLAIDEKLDYASNVHPLSYPDGLDVEVFTFDALSIAYHNAELPSEKEHVTPYIIKNSNFKQGNVKNPLNISRMRWTLDYKEDYEVIKLIYQYLYPKNKHFLMEDILQLLKEKPELAQLNSHISGNDGYQKSLLDDKKFLEARKQ